MLLVRERYRGSRLREMLGTKQHKQARRCHYSILMLLIPHCLFGRKCTLHNT